MFIGHRVCPKRRKWLFNFPFSQTEEDVIMHRPSCVATAVPAWEHAEVDEFFRCNRPLTKRTALAALALVTAACASAPGGDHHAASTVLVRNHALEPVVVTVNGRRTAILGLREAVCVGLFGAGAATVSYRPLGARNRVVEARTAPPAGSAWMWALSGHDRDEFALHSAQAPCTPSVFR
jgi:hypothetical protein